MPFCGAVNFNGVTCNRDATDSTYFWFYDANKRINRVFHVCQQHSNQIINELIESENGYTRILDTLYKKIKSKKKEISHGSSITEEREKIKQAKLEGRPLPRFESVKTLQNDISDLYKKIEKFKELKNRIRNHTCRYCDYLLNEPNESEDQIGSNFSHADFHSGKGYRREVILFHTECGISWILSKVNLSEKELSYVRPKLKGQSVLFT